MSRFHVAFLAHLLTACGSDDDLDRLQRLQTELTRDSRARAVSVNVLNDTLLIVSVLRADTNATVATALFCRRVGEYVRDHYEGYQKLRTIVIKQHPVPSGNEPATTCRLHHTDLEEPSHQDSSEGSRRD